MMNKNVLIRVLGIVCVVFLWPVSAAIHSETVDYVIDSQPFQGYLSYDDAVQDKRPGVLVVHEWWGHNGYARRRAEMLASLGYVAFALDMYGRGKLAQHPDDAGKFMHAALADWNVAKQRFLQALQLLQQQPVVDSTKIAAIGYCFGGGMVLNMAKSGADLLGVVSFHGSLAPLAAVKDGQVKAEILVFNGADDPFITTEQIDGFKTELQKAGAQFEFVNYPGVKHSFTNPEADEFGKRFNLPLVYDLEADRDSWLRMQQFLRKIFK